MYLLRNDLNRKLTVLLNRILEGHDQATYHLLAVVELHDLITDGAGADNFIELNEGLSPQITILRIRS